MRKDIEDLTLAITYLICVNESILNVCVCVCVCVCKRDREIEREC